MHKFMGIKNYKIILPVIALFMAGLACEINVGGPEVPEATIPVSTEAVESLNELWKTAADNAIDSGTINLVVTEAQLTSLVAFRLQQEENPLIEDPQVLLRDDTIQIFGKARRQNLVATIQVVLSVEIDEEGVPSFKLESADFGPLPVPDELLTGLSMAMDEAFTGSVGPVATGIRVESIVIGGGLMAISGQVR